MKQEKKEAIDRMSKHYHELSEQYGIILRWAGVKDRKIVELCSVLDMKGMTNVSVEGILEVKDRQSWEKVVRYGINGMNYLKEDREEMLRMGKKAKLLNELDSDEIRRAVAGFYVATCMTLLSVYLVK